MKTSVAIFVYNEACPLKRFLGELEAVRESIEALGAHCHFIDDASSDDSREVILKAGWRCTSHDRRKGVSGCIDTAYRQAIQECSPHILLFPGNGRVAPSELVLFLRASAMHPGTYIVGNRFLQQIHPTIRSRLAKWLNRMTRGLTEGKINDITSLTRVIPINLLHDIELAPGYRGEHQVHQLALANAYKVIEVPIRIEEHGDRNYSHFGFAGQLSVVLQWLRYGMKRQLGAA